MQSDTTVASRAAVIIIAIHGQKSLHWQLSKYVQLYFWGNELGLKSENEKIRNWICTIHLRNNLLSDDLHRT